MRLLFLSLLILGLSVPLGAVEREIWGSYRLGMLGADRGSAVFAAARAGALDAAKAMEKEHKLAIELVFKAPLQGTAHAQDGALGELFIEGVNGIILDPNPGQELADEVNFLSTQNIPFVMIHRELPGTTPLAFVGSDQTALGHLAMEALGKSLGVVGGDVAVLAGAAGSETARLRLEGAKTVAQASDGKFRPFGIYTCEEALTPSINTVRRVTEEDRARDRKLDAWLFLGPWPLSGAADLPWEPGKLPCVAIGAEPPQLPYIQRGLVDALVAEKYYDWGYRAVVVLIEKLYLKKDPAEAIILVDGELVTKANLDEQLKRWSAWLR